MCRALAYLGEPVVLDHLLYQPDSALVRQSYMPKMLHMLNLAGFGMKAWSHDSFEAERPFSYASEFLPIFDRNLKNLAEKVRAECVLAHVRGVAYSTKVEISPQNVHPFHFEGVRLALAHNGDLARMNEMKPLLAAHISNEYIGRIRGTTDSEWIYALIVSQLRDPVGEVTALELVAAVEASLNIIREARAELGIATSSSVNLFMTTGTQLAAVRYCFDFGCYDTSDPLRVHEANLNFLSLWYTSGHSYGFYEGEWRMQGNDSADSIIIASEPLTRDSTTWLEVPEYSMIYADNSTGATTVEVHYLD